MRIRVRLYRNPWEHTVPNEQLLLILQRVAKKRAEHVAKQFEAGAYKRKSLGLAILDPTAPHWMPSSETMLATIAIGDEGEDFVPNAIAKAVEHRDKGRLAGYGAYVDMTQTQDGDFTYGFSTQVDDTIAGASAQTEIQDACEAGHALVSFNLWTREARKAWVKTQTEANGEQPRWFSNVNQPRMLYTDLADQAEVLADERCDIDS